MIRLDSICPQMSSSGTPFQSVLVRCGEGCSSPAAVGFGKFHSRTYMWSGHSRVSKMSLLLFSTVILAA